MTRPSAEVVFHRQQQHSVQPACFHQLARRRANATRRARSVRRPLRRRRLRRRRRPHASCTTRGATSSVLIGARNIATRSSAWAARNQASATRCASCVPSPRQRRRRPRRRPSRRQHPRLRQQPRVGPIRQPRLRRRRPAPIRRHRPHRPRRRRLATIRRTKMRHYAQAPMSSTALHCAWNTSVRIVGSTPASVTRRARFAPTPQRRQLPPR
mmetsp:Transcript_71181/g.206467  ORF Transcript_71181/g.206467 Transcript_71181/m.206467 type:complete len:212 (+) Transcript_71181:746-1381(+)